jgi:hypothetical protein
MNITRFAYLGFVSMTLGASACGGTQSSTGLTAVPTTRMEPNALASASGRANLLVGTWHGVVQFEETIAGQTKSAKIESQLEFGANALPTRLPGLGFMGAWQNYGDGGPSASENGIGKLLGDGRAGDIYVYCTGEADGPANQLALDPIRASAAPSRFEWQYVARYPFVDLVDYSLYDYAKPTAPTATLRASEAYTLDRDHLVVVATAQGNDANGRAIVLKLSGVLEKGPGGTGHLCKWHP